MSTACFALFIWHKQCRNMKIERAIKWSGQVLGMVAEVDRQSEELSRVVEGKRHREVVVRVSHVRGRVFGAKDSHNQHAHDATMH